MKTVLTIVARIEAKNDKIDLVKSELAKLIDATHQELGCIHVQNRLTISNLIARFSRA